MSDLDNSSKPPVWDETVDFLVAGTGSAALSSAITASELGLKVLVVEAAKVWGGSTAMSGGGLWMPGHPKMKSLGIQDSEEKFLTYLDQCVGKPEDAGPATSLERRKAYYRSVPEVYTMLERLGVKWIVAKKYPDYYPDLEGGIAGGRTIEAAPFNMKKLGNWEKTVRKNLPPLPILSGESYLLARAWSSPDGFIQGAKMVFRTLAGLITGKRLSGLGLSIASRLMYILIQKKVEVRLETPVTDLIIEDNKVLGAVIKTPDGERRIQTRKGVMFGAGGFAHRQEWRKKYQGVEGHSVASPDDLGTPIEIGMNHGAALALMDDAWWGPGGAETSKSGASFLVWERSMPFCIIVDQEGKRYANESTSYVDFGHAMLKNDKARPSWLIMDARLTKRFMFTPFMAGKQTFFDEKKAFKANTINELANLINVPATNLSATVTRFNEFARKGVDEDFERGRTAYDNYYGQPSNKPNPNLGTIEKAPFIAFQMVLSDLGTKGGLLTDENAQVIDEKGQVIEGFYASGNTAASVVGRTYPGAGSTIGPAIVFGYLGAKHAASKH